MFRRFRRTDPPIPSEDPPGPGVARRGVNPVLIEARGYLAQGAYDAAVTMAFHRVLADIERAYGVTFPAGWTLDRIIDQGLRAPTTEVGRPLRELYRAYAPIRYGPPDPQRPRTDLVTILEDVYGLSAMWRLYAATGGGSSRPAAGSAPAPEGELR